MVGMLALPMASASDIDGDGVEDSSDDCPYAPGNSSTDRTGCPDRDGDGKSDWNDAWTSLNPNFQKDLQISQNYDFNDVDHSPDGTETARVRRAHVTLHLRLYR